MSSWSLARIQMQSDLGVGTRKTWVHRLVARVACCLLALAPFGARAHDSTIPAIGVKRPTNSPRPTIPHSTGSCPRFDAAWATVHPEGLAAPRKVRVWRSQQTPARPGPLLIFWHGTRQSPRDAHRALGMELARLVQKGAMVLAPVADPAAGVFPWHLVAGRRLDDLRVADELVACAVQQGLVDPRRIHMLGMSAGGIMSAEMSYRRSSYVASVAAFSGGLIRRVPKELAFVAMAPVMLIHGGRQDKALVNFARASRFTAKTARDHQSQAILCNHGQGHHLPSNLGAAVTRFFDAHPYGATPWQRAPAHEGGLDCSTQPSGARAGLSAPPRLARLLGPSRPRKQTSSRQRWKRFLGRMRRRR